MTNQINNDILFTSGPFLVTALSSIFLLCYGLKIVFLNNQKNSCEQEKPLEVPLKTEKEILDILYDRLSPGFKNLLKEDFNLELDNLKLMAGRLNPALEYPISFYNKIESRFMSREEQKALWEGMNKPHESDFINIINGEKLGIKINYDKLNFENNNDKLNFIEIWEKYFIIQPNPSNDTANNLINLSNQMNCYKLGSYILNNNKMLGRHINEGVISVLNVANTDNPLNFDYSLYYEDVIKWKQYWYWVVKSHHSEIFPLINLEEWGSVIYNVNHEGVNFGYNYEKQIMDLIYPVQDNLILESLPTGNPWIPYFISIIIITLINIYMWKDYFYIKYLFIKELLFSYKLSNS